MKRFIISLLLFTLTVPINLFAENVSDFKTLLFGVLSNHERIKIAKLRIEEAKSHYLAECSRQFLSPNLEASLGLRREEDGTKGLVSSIGLTQTLFEGGKARLLKAKAKNHIEKEEISGQEEKIALAYEVKEILFLYLYYSKRSEVLKDAYGKVKTARDYTEELFKSGRTIKLKVLEAEALQDEIRQGLFEANEWQIYFLTTLKELLGLQDNDPLPFDTKESFYPAFPSLEEAFDIFSDSNISLKYSDKAIEEERLDLKLEKSKAWPKLSAYGLLNHSPRFGDAEEGGLKLSWDFLEMGGRFDEIHAGELKVEEAQARKSLTMRLRKHELRKLYSELSILGEKEKSSSKELKARNTDYQNNRYELDLGTKSFLDLVEPILKLKETKLSVLEAELSIQIKKSEILKTLGLIWFDMTNEEVAPNA